MYKKKLPLGIRIVLGFLSVLLCICLFFTTLLTIVVADLNVLTSKDGLQSIVTQVLFPKSAPVRVTPKLAGGGFSGLGDFSGIEFGADGLNQDALIDSLYDIIAESAGGELPVTRDQVDELLEQTTIPEFITEKVSSIVSDAFTGELTTTITKEEVMTLVQENAAIIEETLDIEIEDEVIESVGQWIEETDVMDTVQAELDAALGDVFVELNGPSDSETSDTSSKSPSSVLDLFNGNTQLNGNVGDVLIVFRAISSTNTVLLCIGACLLLLVLLLLTHWGRPFAAIRSAGIPVMIAGALMLLPTAFAAFLPEGNMVVTIVQKVLSLTGTVSMIAALLGLVMIVGGSVLNSIFKRRARKPAAFATAPVAAGVCTVPAAFDSASMTFDIPAAPQEIPESSVAPFDAAAPIQEEVPAEASAAEEAPAEEAAPAEETTPVE